jgi:hypothetical protein
MWLALTMTLFPMETEQKQWAKTNTAYRRHQEFCHFMTMDATIIAARTKRKKQPVI